MSAKIFYNKVCTLFLLPFKREGLFSLTRPIYPCCRKYMVSNLTFTSLVSLFSGLYGVLFEKHTEAAFANYRLWESCGFVIAFGYSTTLRVYIKLYILLAVLMLSMVTYGVVEYLEAKRSPGTPAASEKENKGPHTQETFM